MLLCSLDTPSLCILWTVQILMLELQCVYLTSSAFMARARAKSCVVFISF